MDEKKLAPTPVPAATNLINTKILAGICGTQPKALRRKLRAKWYNDGVHTDYGWKPGDKILNEILASYGKGPMTGEAKAPRKGKTKVNKIEQPSEVAATA